jgi:lysyl-tRNA synthetase class I
MDEAVFFEALENTCDRDHRSAGSASFETCHIVRLFFPSIHPLLICYNMVQLRHNVGGSRVGSGSFLGVAARSGK